MNNNKIQGYVYILTNPSFREDWVKIGKSSRPVDVRSKELDNTAVPLPFEIYATLKTSKYDKVEKNIRWFIENAENSELKAMGARGRENLEKNLTRNVSVKKYAEEILKL